VLFKQVALTAPEYDRTHYLDLCQDMFTVFWFYLFPLFMFFCFIL